MCSSLLSVLLRLRRSPKLELILAGFSEVPFSPTVSTISAPSVSVSSAPVDPFAFSPEVTFGFSIG